jgi:plastocyanin
MQVITQFIINYFAKELRTLQWISNLRRALCLLLFLCLILSPATLTADITAHIGTRGSVFDPLEVTINAGETVEWDQNDITEHTVTSNDGLFDSSDLEPDSIFTYQFSTPGDYPYYCTIHGFGMSGVVHVVAAAPNTPPTTPVNVAPANNAANQPTSVQLRASVFSDSDSDTHAASQWVLRYTSNNAVAIDSGELSDSGSLTNYSPTGLSGGTGYDWTVRYKDNRGAWSDYSSATHFTTLVTSIPPTLLTAGGFTNGNWRLLGVGNASSHFAVLATTNFIQWTNIGSATSDVSGSFFFIDSNAVQFRSRFYQTTNRND